MGYKLPMISAIDESISMMNGERIISYGLVLGELNHLLTAYDLLRGAYIRYYKKTFGIEYPYQELKFSNLVRDSIKNGLDINYVINVFVIPSLRKLRELCICRSIVIKKYLEEKIIEIADLFNFKRFHKRSIIIAGILKILLQDIYKCEVRYDRGLLIRPKDVQTILRRVFRFFKLVQGDSLNEHTIQIADFIAGSSKYLKMRNAYFDKNIYFVYLVETT